MSRLNELLLLRERIQREIDAERAAEMERNRKRRRVAICGTDSGYYRHLRKFNEPACVDCLDAHRLARQEREIRRRKRVA